jgi:hypothetical protein
LKSAAKIGPGWLIAVTTGFPEPEPVRAALIEEDRDSRVASHGQVRLPVPVKVADRESAGFEGGSANREILPHECRLGLRGGKRNEYQGRGKRGNRNLPQGNYQRFYESHDHPPIGRA